MDSLSCKFLDLDKCDSKGISSHSTLSDVQWVAMTKKDQAFTSCYLLWSDFHLHFLLNVQEKTQNNVSPGRSMYEEAPTEPMMMEKIPGSLSFSYLKYLRMIERWKAIQRPVSILQFPAVRSTATCTVQNHMKSPTI